MTDTTEYQKVILGTLLVEPAAMEACEEIEMGDFDTRLAPIWQVMKNLYEQGALSQGEVIRVLRANNVLDSLGENKDVTGEEYLFSLFPFADTTALPKAVATVIDAGIWKNMSWIARDLLAQSRNGRPAIEVLEETIDKFYKARRASLDSLMFIGDMLPGYSGRMDELRSGKRVHGWSPRGPVYDLTGRAAENEYIMVAAATGGGKSTQMREQSVLDAFEGGTVMVWNGENSKASYIDYGICIISTLTPGLHLTSTILKDPKKMTEEQWNRYNECKEKLAGLRIIVNQMTGFPAMRFMTIQAIKKFGVNLVQFDQLMNMVTTVDIGQIDAMSYKLRDLAMETNTPIMCAHQIRKQTQMNGKGATTIDPYKEPFESDLHFGGSRAATQVWLNWPQRMDDEEAGLFPENLDSRGFLLPEQNRKVTLMKVKVGKNSYGEVGVTDELAWYKGSNRIMPLARDWRGQRAVERAKGKPVITKTFNPVPKPTR